MLSTTHRRLTVDDKELHYASAGDAGSPVLLVHGFPESWSAFCDLIPLLAERHRVIAVDLPGFGDSTAGASGGSAGAADTLRALLDELDLGPVHLLAQDIGGTVGFRLATDGPERVASYTAVETALPGFGGEGLADVTHGGAWYIGALTTPGVPETLFAGRERAFLADILFPAYGVELRDDQLDELVRAFSRPDGLAGAADLFSGLLHDGEAFQALAAERPLTVPTLAVGTMAGDFTRTMLDAVSSTEPQSVQLDDVGHYLAIEAPDRLAATVLPFWAQVDGR